MEKTAPFKLNSLGFIAIEMVAFAFVAGFLFIGLKIVLKLRHRESPAVIAQRQCEDQMAGATSLFSTLFQKQDQLSGYTAPLGDVKFLNENVYGHASIPVRHFIPNWFHSPVLSRTEPMVLNSAQLKLDEANLAQNLYNSYPDYCKQPFGLNSIAGKSIRNWLGSSAPEDADEVFLKIEPVDKNTNLKIANCPGSLKTAIASEKQARDASRDGYRVDGNPNLGFELTWTAVQKNSAGRLQAGCQVVEHVQHASENLTPASPVLMSMTNGNGANLLDPERARTTCDTDDGQFNEVRMSWDFDHPLGSGEILLCRTWTVYEAPQSAAAANQKRARFPASVAVNPNTLGLKAERATQGWESCANTKFNLGNNLVPIEMNFNVSGKTTLAKMKIANLPKQDAEYFIEMKVVNQAGDSSPQSSIAHFIVDVNRPGILQIAESSEGSAAVSATLSGPSPSNYQSCELIASDIPNASACYDGEKCLIRSTQVSPGAHHVELRARDVCGKLSATAQYNFNQQGIRNIASVSSSTAPLPALANSCVRPTIRNFAVRCQKSGVWAAWSSSEYPLATKESETVPCEIRFDALGASTIEHHGVYDPKNHRDYVFQTDHPETWTSFTESFPVGFVSGKSFFRSERPLVLFPVGDCFDGQPVTFEMATSCQQGSCQFKPSISRNTCASN